MILASASPRRAQLLRDAGIAFSVHPAHVDESVQAKESAEAYVCRVAESKALAVAAVVAERPVLAADTAVVVGGQILGKPRDETDAARMLRRVSGRTHAVVTGLASVRGGATAADGGGPSLVETAVARTAVELASLSDAEIEWYVATGEPMDKAGGYAIQGVASRFVTRIEGSYSNVVGLPVALVHTMLGGG